MAGARSNVVLRTSYFRGTGFFFAGSGTTWILLVLYTLLDLLFSVVALRVELSFCLLLRTVRVDPPQHRLAAEGICSWEQVLFISFVLNSSHMKLFLSRLRKLEDFTGGVQ